ncbi:anti-sigma-B factor antagonist [Capsulimonas corticalis]|uniref:Anti-sigma factor antagonist n=1 Tax=Capsulimonas corticalis TaxID=2219043 RepID=A0A402CZB9_9BACT|nr:STAS domain-containing protein [Capsulimonas corticalis]BDI29451.1 anti-sigma-B factor antagonist [Capsulimonas corticalis]
MELTIDNDFLSANARLLIIEGEIDVYTSPSLREQVSSLALTGINDLVIDLAKVKFLDSTGLGVLIGALKRMREAGGNLYLIAPAARILRIFEITGLDKSFDICTTLEEAKTKVSPAVENA